MVTFSPATRTSLSSWGNYPREECELYRPATQSEFEQIVLHSPHTNIITRGRGRSYGDAALNRDRGVVLSDPMNQILSFDTESGILNCECGVSFAEILNFILPKGFVLPITPGTKHISVGGAIAADVHGKNHHRDGTISSQLLDFRLLAANGSILLCSREENPDLFWATLGGMGLTGAILDARLQLRPADSAYVDTSTQPCANLDQAFELMETGDRDYEYAVAWIDCLAQGRSLGRSVLMRANPAELQNLPPKVRASPFAIPKRLGLGVPFQMPSMLLNPLSMRLFNSAFYFAHRTRRNIVDWQRYFYPLDSIAHWNRIYGRRGVLQYQLVLPSSTARQGLIEILEHTSASGRASFLAVLKTTGPANASPLSFPIEGMSLALDFPNTGPDLLEMLRELDQMVLRHSGRVYLAKDSCLDAADFMAMYPRLEEFRTIKTRHDPENRFSSSLSRRLRIVEAS